MKLLNEVRPLLAQYGYRKKGDSFWKEGGGFYKLINFQKGAYGSYFFVNVALHPQGLPLLYTGGLHLVDRPRESQCALRQRVEAISPGAKAFSGEIGYPEKAETVKALLSAVLPDVEGWLDRWGSPKTILGAEFEELSPLFSSVPILWRKEFWLLKTHCALVTGDRGAVEGYLSLYRAENPDLDFSPVDRYMEERLAALR